MATTSCPTRPLADSSRHSSRAGLPLGVAQRHERVNPTQVWRAPPLAYEAEPVDPISAGRTPNLVLARSAARARRDNAPVDPAGRHGAAPDPDPTRSIAERLSTAEAWFGSHRPDCLASCRRDRSAARPPLLAALGRRPRAGDLERSGPRAGPQRTAAGDQGRRPRSVAHRAGQARGVHRTRLRRHQAVDWRTSVRQRRGRRPGRRWRIGRSVITTFRVSTSDDSRTARACSRPST